MNPDFVFFDGQLWPYDEWAKIAPLSFFNDDKSLDDVKWFDPSGYNEQQKSLNDWYSLRLFFLQSEKLTEIIMKHFKVCINYGRKCAAYETVVTAATEADAKHQAKVLAAMSGFDAAIKKITVQEC